MSMAALGWFLFRWVSISVTAIGGAFYVADYVTSKSMNGFSVAASNLQSSFNNLDGSVKKLDETLRSELRLLTTERQTLADQVATKIVELQRGQTGTETELRYIRQGIDRMEGTLKEMRANPIRFSPALDAGSVVQLLNDKKIDPKTQILLLPSRAQ